MSNVILCAIVLLFSAWYFSAACKKDIEDIEIEDIETDISEEIENEKDSE